MSDPSHPSSSKEEAASSAKPSAKRGKWRRRIGRTFFWGTILIVVGLLIIRPMLPTAVRWYVNRTLDENLEYQGKIEDITIDLWKGAYSIHDIRLLKKTGNVPEPLFDAKVLELAVQWNALLHGKLVGKVVMNEPKVNFVDGSDESEAQTGAGGPWLKTLEDLFPFKINSLYIHNGSIHFRSYKSKTPVDVYLSNLEASMDDFTNIANTTTPLLTTVEAKGMAMDQANFELKMKINPFSYRPTFQLAARLLGLDVTKLNDLAHTYGQFVFERGWFDVVIQANANEGQIDGEVTPLFRNLKVFDLLGDITTDDNPLQYFWQALLGAATEALKNQSRDQFGTSIPFTGDLDKPNTDILATVGNVLRNAFVRAYLPKLQQNSQRFESLEFGTPSITNSIPSGDSQ